MLFLSSFRRCADALAAARMAAAARTAVIGNARGPGRPGGVIVGS